MQPFDFLFDLFVDLLKFWGVIPLLETLGALSQTPTTLQPYQIRLPPVPLTIPLLSSLTPRIIDNFLAISSLQLRRILYLISLVQEHRL